MATLSLKAIHRVFDGGVIAVDDVSLNFVEGELTALLGPSGCGKTSLLRIIAGLDRPSRGVVMLSGNDITSQPAHIRRFGMVFQSFALFPHLNVAENVAYSLTISGVGKLARINRANQLLELVKLENYGSRRISELSGGQRQRVAIARALAQSPDIFLLDEPMSALDAQLRETMQIELRLLQQELGITTIVVTHDQREAMTMADKIVVMNQGGVEQVGSAQEVYRQPNSQFVASFIGSTNFVDGIVRGGCIELADGQGLLELLNPVPFLEGSDVTVGCRPESTLFFDQPPSCPNQLSGEVSFVRDIGSVREVFVKVGEKQLICEMRGSQVRDTKQGDSVFIHLPAGALRVYPGSRVISG